MNNKHSMSDLYQMQALPLSVKIRKTENRIREWVDEYGEEGCYVSFSGGKDSTVLLDIIWNRLGFTNIPAVFVDVPTQYPELKEFATEFTESVRGSTFVILKPKMSFAKVCEKYGFPIISKEVSQTVYYAKKYLEKLQDGNKILTDRQTDRQTDLPYANQMADLLGIERRETKEYVSMMKMGVIPDIPDDAPTRLKILLGRFIHKEKGVVTDEYSQLYNKKKFAFMLESDFFISHKCCDEMKKKPIKKYAKETGRNPIIATMASESKLRTQDWIVHGCNGFDRKEPISKPMSFWTEQDVLQYIKEYNIPICSVYGEVVVDYEKQGQVEGQMRMDELESTECELFDFGKPLLKTTGCDRTGCVLCGFGCHLESEENARFLRLKETHPKFHNLLYVLKNNGVTYAEAIDWINEHGNYNIRY